MECEEVVCDVHQEQEIIDLLATMNIGPFQVNQFIRDDDVVDPSVWLGRNSNFCPDPLIWVARELYHSAEGQMIQFATDDTGEADDLVWGEETELELDIDPASESCIKPLSNSVNALAEDPGDDGLEDALSPEENAADRPHRSALVSSHAPDDPGCSGT